VKFSKVAVTQCVKRTKKTQHSEEHKQALKRPNCPKSVEQDCGPLKEGPSPRKEAFNVAAFLSELGPPPFQREEAEPNVVDVPPSVPPSKNEIGSPSHNPAEALNPSERAGNDGIRKIECHFIMHGFQNS